MPDDVREHPARPATDIAWVDADRTPLRRCVEAIQHELDHENAVVVHDVSGAVVGANNAAAEVLGLTWSQLVGRTSADPRWAAVSELGVPLRGPDHPAMRTLADGEPVHGFTMGVQLPPPADGGPGAATRTRWIEIASRPVREHEQLMGVLVTFTDFSMSARGLAAEDRLRDAYRMLAENASDVVSRSDVAGVIEWITPSVVDLLGWRADEVIGRVSIDLVHPDDHALLIAARSEVDSMGQARVEVRGLRRDGGERWVALRARSILDHDGKLIGRVTGWTDIDEIVRGRTALEESELRFRLLAQNATDLVVQAGSDDRISWVSPTMSGSLGWSEDDLLGQSFLDLVHPDDRPLAVEVLRGAESVGGEIDGVAPVIVRLRATSGAYRSFSCKPAVRSIGNETLVGLRDVDDLVRTREAAEQDRAYLRETIDALLDPQVRLEPIGSATSATSAPTDLRVDLANSAAARYLGLSVEEMTGQSVWTVLPVVRRSGLWDVLCDVLATGVPAVIDDVADPTDLGPDPRHVDLRVVRAGRGVGVTWRDVSDRHRYHQRLTDLATHDPLTGLANRAAVMDGLVAALTARPAADDQVAVLMIDLDRFKDVNDTLGHAAGDELLQQAATRLESVVREHDLVARLGGDEFLVVLSDVGGRDRAIATAERIVHAFRQPFDVNGVDVSARASVGIALAEDAHVELGATVAALADELVRLADAAMYAVKSTGRDRAQAVEVS
jgi:diguanylate cyclase (GGDEF)-like protein/PAS domain S-box-containing protein